MSICAALKDHGTRASQRLSGARIGFASKTQSVRCCGTGASCLRIATDNTMSTACTL